MTHTDSIPHSEGRPLAVVTGASSGIGAATARSLAAAGYEVICAARRLDRCEELATEIGGRAIHLDVTDANSVDELAKAVGPRLKVLVNNAGGAVGREDVADSDFDAWTTMYNTNMLGSGRVTKALLPAITADEGTLVFITSSAAETTYEGGAGYCGAKSAQRALVEALRLELCGEPVRVCEISPGLVHTEEFSLVRFRGDQARADAVYEGIPGMLIAEDVADCVMFVVELPDHVNIDRLVVRPRAQASNHKVYRETEGCS